MPDVSASDYLLLITESTEMSIYIFRIVDALRLLLDLLLE